MRYFRILVAGCAFFVSGCMGSRQPLNPPQLVTARDTDISIQLFMQATILLARYYGFDTIDYELVRDKSVRHGYSVLPFMPPVSGRATPPFAQATLGSEQGFHISLTGADFRAWANSIGGQSALVNYYVNTGWRAAQMVCRNYMLGIEEKNGFLEFLQKEFNIGTGLAGSILALAGANGTATASVLAGASAVNLALDEYQDYRFMTIVDRDAARALVETAQNLYAARFLASWSAANKGKGIPNASPQGLGFFPTDAAYFSEAVHVLNLIEYQCTRPGIRALLNKAARNTNGGTMTIDPVSEAIVFDPTIAALRSDPPKAASPSPSPNPPVEQQKKPATGVVTPLSGQTK